MLAVVLGLVLASVAQAEEGTVVTGASGSGALTITPSAGPVVSPNVDLAGGTRVFFVESMPKSMSVRRVTIGDLARASECSESPQVELSLYSFAGGSDLGSGTLVARSSSPRVFGPELGRVTWLIDPTALESSGTYAFVVKRASGSCATGQERSWAHNASQVDGGERACASLQDGSNRYRLWHVQEAEDASACRALRLSNFAAGMPTGWAEAELAGEEASINTVRGRCATDLEAIESEWSGGIVCQLNTFTEPRTTTRDGWYYGLPWNGTGLEGRPRDLYLSLEPDVAPVVTTSAASDVHGTSVRLNGSINAGGSPTHYRFEWGTETRYGSVLPEPDAEAGEGSSASPVSAALRGLEPGTTYHYRLVAAHGEGRAVDGEDRTFTTATPPVEASAPAIAGMAVHFQTLTASSGNWSGTSPISYSYQWRRCDSRGASCADIEGATNRTYLLEAGDIGRALRVVVTATNAAGEVSATSAASAVVTDIPPSDDALPQVYGQAIEGERLTASHGSWSGAATISYAYQWRRCDSRGASCSDLEGAREADYTASSEDVGSTLRVAVTASNSAGSVTAVSDVTVVVAAANLRNTSAPAISEETTVDGDALIGEPGSWTGAGTIAYAYRWQRCDAEGQDCANIPLATEPTYVLEAADVGNSLRLVVTASNESGSKSAVSGTTEAIPDAAPSNVDTPSVTGNATVDGLLSAVDGTWAGARPMDFTYQWQRCDERGAGCEDIEEAIEPFYRPAREDAGDTVRVQVTARSSAGEDTASSAVTPVLLAEATLANTTVPAITGTLLSGETLSVTEGLWTGTGTIRYAYQWQRCDADRTNCTDIVGATEASYTLERQDVGHSLVAVVTATDSNEIAEASARSGQVRAEGAPAESEAPVLSGSAVVGETLSASAGRWTGTGPITYSYKWQVCEDDAACQNIAGASASTYTLTSDQLDATVRAVVTATNASGSTTTVSAATATVTPPTPYSTEAPTITGTARAGQTLSGEHGSWTGAGSVSYAYQWQRCDSRGERCADVEGATEARYTLAGEDVNGTVRLLVTATDEASSARATSEVSAVVVAAGAPLNTMPPSVSGTAEAGQTLTVTEGTWSGTGPITYGYQWQRCDPGTSECEDVEGATASSYRATSDDVGSRLQVVVTATNGAGADHAASALTTTVTGPEPAPRVLANVTPPSISGTASEGSTLTAQAGEWTEHDAITYAYQWRRCDSAGADCADVPRATSTRYTLGEADVGSTLRVAVTASSTSGTRAMTSDASTVVALSAPTSTTAPAITGTATDGQTLSADEGRWTGRPETIAYAWQRCDREGRGCATITGAPAAPTYTLTDEDVGSTVRVDVTATNSAGSRSAASGTTAVVAASTPANVTLPAVSGNLVQGFTASASDGSWSGTAPLTYTYQWRRCDSRGERCADIEGATAAEHRLGAEDVESTLRVVVTAHNAAGNSSSTSAATAAIGGPQPPVNVSAPAIYGHANDGQALGSGEGLWSGLTPIRYAYQWQRCDSRGERCADVEGATEFQYTLAAEDIGSTMRLAVQASNASGSQTAYSAATEVVATAAPTNAGAPSIPSPYWAGAEARAQPGYWAGSEPITLSYQWKRCEAGGERCSDIEGATAATYTFAEADAGSTVRVAVTATNAHGSSAPALSSATPVIAAGPITSTAAPVLSGTPSLDWFGTLTASAGRWSGEADFYTYQWRRCDSRGESCADVEGATASWYQPAVADLGHTLLVVVTAHAGPTYTVSASSAASTVVVPQTVGEPSNDVAPAFEGRLENGHLLRADPGVWGGYTPITYVYRWQRCTTPTSCSDISGATEQTYRLGTSDIGRLIRVLVDGRNSSGLGRWAESSTSEPIADPAPSNLAAPSITGEPIVGAPLGVDDGEWAGAVSWWIYSWQRCDASGSRCVDIANAFGSRYSPTRADLGSTLRVVVRAENAQGSASATSGPSAVVAAAALPSNTVDPTISGRAETGSYLFAEPGSWSGSPDISYDYQWERCEESGANCTDIAGANQSSYRVARTDVGSTLRASVTATNGAGSLTAKTDATEVVPSPGVVSNVFPPSLSEWSSPSFGWSYGAWEVGLWTGAPAVTDQWQRCDPLTYEPETGSMTCVDIPGATDPFDYVPLAADVGFKLRLKETATGAEESQVAYSEPSPEVQQFTYGEGGTYRGLAVAGETITAESTVGSYAGLPVTTHYTFLRENEGEEPTVLQEGEEASYRLTEGEIGHHVLVQMISTIWRADRAAVITSGEVELTLPTVEPAPTAETLPAIEGTTTAGATLTASHGEWSGGGGPLTYAFQWRRCNAEGAGCADIEAATATVYALAPADVGHTLRVVVTATGGTVRGSATSNATSTIAAARAASNTETPAISGEAAELHTLTAEHGRWTGDAPITYAYQWQQCKPDGSECQDIEGASQQTYRIPTASADFTLRVQVAATNAAGTVTATSSTTSAVTAAPAPQNTALPRLTLLGAAEVGSTLMTDGGSWQNIDHNELGYVWQRCDTSGRSCTEISGADASAYDLTSDDIGSRIQVEVLAQNETGEAVAVSELSPTIVASTGTAAGMLVYADGEALGTAQSDGTGAEVVSWCPETGPAGGCDFDHPRISPNGKMLLASRQPTLEGPAQIVLMNRDGSDVRAITTTAAAYEPSWTPDGTAITYTTEDGEGHTSIARVSADGSNAEAPETIPTAGTDPDSASYSTDGERLIYAATEPEGHRALYTANANGESAHEVTFDAPVADVDSPTLSPDGTQVTFAAHTTTPDMPDEVRDLYTANVDGSNLHQITQDGSAYDSAAPLTDGTLVAVHQDVIVTEFGFGQTIEVVNATAWQMDANGGNGHPLPLNGAKEISVGPHGGPVAHASVLGGSHNPESGLKPDERAFCRAHVYFCYVTRGDERKAVRLQELLFTSSADPHISDSTQSNAFRHALWVALMTHTAYHIDYSPLLAFRLAELHEHEQHGKPEWKSHDPGVRRPSLMDLHNDLAGYLYVLQRLGKSHNEHYICTHVLNIVRHGKLLTAAQVDHEPQYVTQEESYWFKHLDTFGHPVQILESILPINECG